jgi:hypothetical protein
MDINMQYTFYLNQLFSEEDPHSCEDIEFLEAKHLGIAEIRSSNEEAIRSITQTLITLDIPNLVLFLGTINKPGKANVKALTLKGVQALKVFNDYLKERMIERQIDRQSLFRPVAGGNARPTTLSIESLQHIYPAFHNQIKKVSQEYSESIEIHTIDNQAATKFEARLRYDIENKLKEMDGSLLWIDIDSETRLPFVGVSLQALKVLEEICRKD